MSMALLLRLLLSLADDLPSKGAKPCLANKRDAGRLGSRIGGYRHHPYFRTHFSLVGEILWLAIRKCADNLFKLVRVGIAPELEPQVRERPTSFTCFTAFTAWFTSQDRQVQRSTLAIMLCNGKDAG